MKYERIIQLVLFACLWMGWLDGVLSAVLSLFITIFNFIAQFLPFL